MVMHHEEPDCLPKRLVCCLQSQGHSEGSYDQNMTFCYISSKLLIFLQLNLVWWHIITSWIVLWKDWIALCGQGHRKSSIFQLMFIWMISLNCWTFCNQIWYMAVHYHGPMCPARLVCCLQFQGQREGSGNQIWLSTICTELLIFLQPNLIGWYIIRSWRVLCKHWISVFKAKVTMKIQDFIKSLCTLHIYLLYHWSLGSHTRYDDLLLLIYYY